jgi:hypothetical protein
MFGVVGRRYRPSYLDHSRSMATATEPPRQLIGYLLQRDSVNAEYTSVRSSRRIV